MRPFILLLLVFAGSVLPSRASAAPAQSITVAQLGQFLAQVHKMSDARLASDIDGFVLTERPDLLQFLQWQSRLPGRRSRQAFTALVDPSVLLAPPPAEILPEPPPQTATQVAILSSAREYVSQTLSRLPDFSALRVTQNFDDAPLAKASGQALHFRGQSTVPVSYSNGQEQRGVEKTEISVGRQANSSLATAGEFGPILAVVLADVVHGSVTWAGWQQSTRGRLAVFHYSVPQSGSSYLLTLMQDFQPVNIVPAYFGEIAIDPASGAILRITLLTGAIAAQNVLESAIVVDYGTVQLGGRDYICPLRGVALMRSLVDSPHGGTSVRTQLNDTAFTGYHLLRGDVRILSDAP